MSVTIAKIHAILLFCSLTEAVLYSPRFTSQEQSSLEYNKLVRLIAVTVCGPANVNKTKDTARPQGWTKTRDRFL